MTKTSYRVGLDIGGTFTDFVLYDSEQRRVALHKCLTTPHDPSIAALEGLGALTAEADITLADVAEIVHGTTLVTNAIIERRGAKLGLLTTHGFRDILEMGTEQRYDIYDLFLSFPDPLVSAPPPARNRASASTATGALSTPLDAGEVRAAARSSSTPASRRSRSASCTPTATRRTSRPSRAIVARISRTCRLALVRRRGGAAGNTSAA